MAKEPEPRSIGENQDPVGGLSTYVSERLNDISRLNVEAEAQARTAKDREMGLFLQGTALLQEYLLELAVPMDELLLHFRVRELLEEVRSRYSRNGIIKTVAPDIFRKIVTQPDPSVNFFHDIYNATNSQPLTLSDLLSSGNFRSIVPSLIGYDDYETKTQPRHAFGKYGLVLEREVLMQGEKTRLIHRSPMYRWLGPGGGHVFEGEGGLIAEGTGEWETYYGIESLFVEVVKAEELKPTYALEYSRRRSGNLVARPRRIRVDQPLEVLKQLIGDDIIKTISRTV